MTYQEQLRPRSASDFLHLHKKTILLIITVATITLIVSAAICIMLDDHSS